MQDTVGGHGTVVVVAVLVLGTGCASADGRAGIARPGDGAARGHRRRAGAADAEPPGGRSRSPRRRAAGLGGLADHPGPSTTARSRPTRRTRAAARARGSGLKVSTTEGGYEAAAFRIGAYGVAPGPSCGSPASGAVAAGSRRRLASYERAPWWRPGTRDLTVDTSTWTPGVLRLPAAHRHGLGDPGAVRRDLRVRRRDRRAGRARHHLAGLQRVGRLQPLRRRQRGRREPRGELRPALQRGDGRQRLPHGRHPGHRARRAAPACRCPTSPTSTCTPRPSSLAAPAATSRWGTTSTGRPPCATSSSGPATPGPTSPSWAPTPCTGGCGWRPAPTGPARRGRRLPALRPPRPAVRAGVRRGDGALPRRRPSPRPEHDLLGMQYECYPVDTDYVVASPRLVGFRGTGVRRGDHVPGLVGPEADRVYPDGRLPRPLQVLSHSPYSCRGVTTTTQSVYYTPAPGPGCSTPAPCAGGARWSTGASARWARVTPASPGR